MSAHYEIKKSIRQLQAEREAVFLKDFHSHEYTFADPLIVINPYCINPLAALVMFKNPERTAVSLTVHGKDAETTLHHVFSGEEEQIIPVLGLYMGTTTDITLELGDISKTFTLETETPKGVLPQEVSVYQDPSYHPADFMFYSSALREFPVALDKNGDVRWLFSETMQWQLRRLKNGHWMIGTERQLAQPYHVSGLYEVDLTGRIYAEYALPGGCHHDFLEMEDGSLLVASNELNGPTKEDVVVLVDRNTGCITKRWDLQEILNKDEGKGSKSKPNDWFHNNALCYDKTNHTITLSGRHIDSIINIDFDTGKLNWILGDPATWPEEKQKYFFKPVGENFEWPYAPHACYHLDSNNIYCFDNGCSRSKDPEKYCKNADNYSRGVHYQIDTERMEIKQLWQYGKERGNEFFSYYISNVIPYGEDSCLIHSGGIGYYNGETWERDYPPVMLDDPNIDAYAITVEVQDDKVVYELKQRGNYYRAVRMKLYEDDYQLDFTPSCAFGSLAPTKEDEFPGGVAECDQPIPEECRVRIEEEDDRVIIRAFVKNDSQAGLILEQDGTQHYYKIQTTLRMLIRLLLAGGKDTPGYSVVYLSVNKATLRGEYDVKVLLEDKIYSTNIKIQGEEK